MRAGDPVPREIGECRHVPRRGHRARLEAAHLARGRRLLCHGAPTDDPAHRRITPEAPGSPWRASRPCSPPPRGQKMLAFKIGRAVSAGRRGWTPSVWEMSVKLGKERICLGSSL